MRMKKTLVSLLILGAPSEIVGPVFARGANIAGLFRVSPRLLCNVGKIRLAAYYFF